jgi:hypothetical protein
LQNPDSVNSSLQNDTLLSSAAITSVPSMKVSLSPTFTPTASKLNLLLGLSNDTTFANLFVCSFCVVQIFALVAKFEKLASIGSKKRMFIKQKDNNEVLCTVKVLINKYYSKLSLHCANDDLRPAMKNVCLDIRNGRVAASDGHTMMIKGLDVVSTEHFTYDYNLPLVNGKDFKKMCSLAKSGSTLTCKLVREQDGNEYWVSECCGYYSKIEANRYVNYSSVLPKISTDNRMHQCSHQIV